MDTLLGARGVQNCHIAHTLDRAPNLSKLVHHTIEKPLVVVLPLSRVVLKHRNMKKQQAICVLPHIYHRSTQSLRLTFNVRENKKTLRVWKARHLQDQPRLPLTDPWRPVPPNHLDDAIANVLLTRIKKEKPFQSFPMLRTHSGTEGKLSHRKSDSKPNVPLGCKVFKRVPIHFVLRDDEAI